MITGEQSFFFVGSSGRAIIIERDAQLTVAVVDDFTAVDLSVV